MADHVDVVWPLTDMENLSATTLTTEASDYVTPRFALGSNLTATALLTGSNADTGFEAVTYEPPFVQLTPKTRVTGKNATHSVTFTVTPKSTHTFKPTTIEFDAVKCGTDGGNFDIYIKNASTAEQALATAVAPLRNKVTSGNPNGYSHHTYTISNVLVKSGRAFQVILYVYNFNGQDDENPKSIAFRNVTVGGEADEPIYDASHFFTAATCSAGNLLDLIATLKDGENATWGIMLNEEPTDFAVTAAEGFTATISYQDKVCTLTASKDGKAVFSVSVFFKIARGNAKPLNRGLMAVKTSAGVLVSWRYRATDPTNKTRFRLYRNNKLIAADRTTECTNYLDKTGTVSVTYKLEVLDANGQVVETQETKSWNDQVKYITLQGGAPTDPTSAAATYTPNDASFCDMDGDGEYEIILKWAPSNEKDAASSGTTSPAFYSCYKLDGTRLWMLHTGPNMFNSAHTTPFIAWDMDGDGYGEFMVKTAPGAIDGEGKYVILPGDDPNANYKGGKGKQETGGEYLTIFDGTTGAELRTIKYHTAYADENSDFWGDSKQNRSERYLSAIAWLDGEDANPSAIFARGYYNGCKIGAYDWDGTNLTMRWLHRGASANSGTVTYANGSVKNLTSSVYGEGAHWICVGDVTGDGKQEIHYGSGALKPDGTTLYRTGFGHGDAMHLSDFIPSRPGLELFMVHEHKPYGADLRDAATGQVLFRTEASGDTGRGIMAHFNSEAEDAYWQSSADANLYDTSQKVIAENVSHGGGAGLSFRIYWNGDLADDFYGKNVLEYWNPEGNGFWRMQINGGNYVYGNYNNDSKQNPCVSGDLLGDWREEIVTWDQSGSDYRLVINATDYQTDYCLPHLMDDYAYRAQLINQNCVYNQPPHVSYDPITRYTIERRVPQNGWDVLYTPYPVQLPEGVTAYSVQGVDAEADTLRYRALAARAVLPARSAVVFKAPAGSIVRFRPTTKSAVTVPTTYLKGCSVDSVLTCNEDTQEYFYTFRTDAGTGARGFFRVEDNTTLPAGTPWLRVKGSANYPAQEQYFWGRGGIPTAVTETMTDGGTKVDTYDLTGRKVKPQRPGLYIQNGHKLLRTN